MKSSRLGIGIAIGLSCFVMLIASGGCREPTQMTLAMSTDMPCRDAKRLAITGGAVSGNIEAATPSTVSSLCEGEGDLGTLVATPSGSKDSEAAFRVVLGVDRPVEQCTALDGYAGCIVARRSLAYIASTPLQIPIRMYLVCKGIPCTADTTCARNGKCLPARIKNAESCIPPKRCFVEGDPDATGEAVPDDGTNINANNNNNNNTNTQDGGDAASPLLPGDDAGGGKDGGLVTLEDGGVIGINDSGTLKDGAIIVETDSGVDLPAPPAPPKGMD